MFKQIFKFAVCFVAVFCLTDGAATPSFITKCKTDDSKCLRQSTNNAIGIFAAGLIDDYGVEPLEPLYIKSLDASQGNLQFFINDATLTGLSNCEAQKVQIDRENSKLIVKLVCSAKLEGDYILKGSVLFVPLEGNGKLHVDLRSAVFNIVVDIVTKTSDEGKKFWQIKNWQYNVDFKDKSTVVFENLLNENEILGRAARELIANNGNDIIKEIGTPFIKHCLAKVVKNINHFFRATTVEDLTIQ